MPGPQELYSLLPLLMVSADVNIVEKNDILQHYYENSLNIMDILKGSLKSLGLSMATLREP